ncbi:cell envelope biogenesis protein TolA [Sphingomonas sp. S1-29]|uniref:cell envelope biogenesis protein TolA n=1 Tax=Sphingomonas sp. S1-29 TaxID=2991074 RepID=UPI00224099D8|nr:cell envelope biogenesis protein TolA [Sphingomonas sp. S1-29]UZK68331.1 cell envelope biogenesis protein TolA [Sphingomonas sp. S1-29]
MDRAEKVGLGVAAAGHVVLFGLLSVGFLATPNPESLVSTPVEVSLVDEVGLVAESPTLEAPSASVAPEEGPPEDAAPPAPAESEPEPAPELEPAPPEPAPAPRPAAKPAPRPVTKAVPRPAAKPAPKAAPKRPAPAEAPPAKAKAAPRPAAKALAKAAPKAAAAKAAPKSAAAKGSGTDAAAKKARPRGSRLGDDFLKGLSADDTPRKASNAAPAQRVGASQLANIGSAIRRQVQPCADRQVTPGPGAERIRVTIRLQLAEDGSLRSRPTVVGQPQGVDDGNRRYVDRVNDLAIATFVGCSPLRGLPAELYDAPGGWRTFTLRYNLPG